MARLSKQAWLEQSLYMLAEVGASGLTIDALTTRLGVTKGSFYHHFKNYQTFKLSLLDFFEEVSTLNVIRITDEGKTPEDKLQRLLETATGHPPSLEVQIRAWALQDEDVREYQARIDEQRIAYVKGIFLEMAHTDAQAQMMAELLYLVNIGGQQLIPPLPESRFEELYTNLRMMFDRSHK